MVNIRSIARRLFGWRANEVLGLDISPSSIKVINLKRCGEEININGGGKVEISEYAGSTVEDRSASTVEAICKCVDLCDCRCNRAVCAVDAPDVAVRSFSFDPMPPEETGYSILMEAEQISPADMAHTVVDYQLVGGYQEGKELKGMLAAARSDAIMEKCHLAEKANLHTILVDVDSLALINCYTQFSNADKSENTAIVNLCDSWANFAVVGGERLPFIRNISHSGSGIFNEIANANNLSTKEVQDILFDVDAYHAESESVREDFMNSLNELVPEISETLRYCQAREKNCKVERVLLSGDCAAVEGVVDLFDDKLFQDVELWNPVKHAGFTNSVNNKDELEKQGPGMAIALGLSMRAI